MPPSIRTASPLYTQLDIHVIGGGVVPEDDIQFLLDKGIKKIFTPGTIANEIAQYIEQLVRGDMNE